MKMARIWHRIVAFALRTVYFDRLKIVGAKNLPKEGPTLFVALHRNGAVDAFVYSAAAPHAIPLISRQWTSNLLGRLLLSGIEVVRDKDTGDRNKNIEALSRCSKHLLSGGEVIVFPEGTSSLKPGHLPFKSGAARIAREYINSAEKLTVIPLAVSYELPWAFRSQVQVLIGSPIRLHARGPKGDTPLGEIRLQMETALEGIIHQADQTEWKIPQTESSSYASFSTCISMLIVGLGTFLNCAPLASAAWAGRTLPDDTNVVSLWKILVGTPAFIVWLGLWIGAAVILGHPTLLAAYLLVTALSGFLYRDISGPLRHREHRYEAV